MNSFFFFKYMKSLEKIFCQTRRVQNLIATWKKFWLHFATSKVTCSRSFFLQVYHFLITTFKEEAGPIVKKQTPIHHKIGLAKKLKTRTRHLKNIYSKPLINVWVWVMSMLEYFLILFCFLSCPLTTGTNLLMKFNLEFSRLLNIDCFSFGKF